ncbi:MAG: hypothetical protein MUC96_15440 [Myxococcaceae bacterium]|nr:hypothetical protein [Myxococcaceae bacterium]
MKRALWVLMLAAACGEPIQPRSTVQQNAIAKSDFDGVWYFRQTVVGVPRGRAVLGRLHLPR